MQTSNYRSLLFEELAQRRRRNPLYSLRAFARDLTVSTTALSDVLSQKRNFSPKNARKVAQSLGLSEIDTQRFLEEIEKGAPTTHGEYIFRQVDDEVFSLISDWHYLAILNLAKLKANNANPRWIAGRLGLDINDARCALDRLVRMGLLQVSSGKLHLTTIPLSTGPEAPTASVKKFHRQTLKLAEDSLDRDASDIRDFSAVSLAVDPALIPEVKAMIREMRRKVTAFLERGTHREVYTLSIQFFPNTRAEVQPSDEQVH